MKQLYKSFIMPLMLLSISAFSAEDDRYSPLRADDTSYMAAQTNTEDARPFNISLSGDWISNTNIKRDHRRYDPNVYRNFQYAEAFADLGFIFYYNSCHKEGLGLTLEYSFVDFDWRSNPFFCQQYFHTAGLSLGGFTKRFNGWLWKAQASMDVDTHTWNFNEYLTLDFLLWGRYDLFHNIGIHIGFLAETGMKVDRVYPIIGIDWKINNSLKLNLVYPVDISLVYNINCNWSVAAASRLFSSRHRTSEPAFVNKSIFVFRSAGGELGFSYDSLSWLTANVHAGYTFAGTVTLSDRHYHHKHHYNVDPSAYVGGELALKF